jgi:hypothetical protein
LIDLNLFTIQSFKDDDIAFALAIHSSTFGSKYPKHKNSQNSLTSFYTILHHWTIRILERRMKSTKPPYTRFLLGISTQMWLTSSIGHPRRSRGILPTPRSRKPQFETCRCNFPRHIEPSRHGHLSEAGNFSKYDKGKQVRRTVDDIYRDDPRLPFHKTFNKDLLLASKASSIVVWGSYARQFFQEEFGKMLI